MLWLRWFPRSCSTSLAPDPVVVDECRSRFGREVSDEEARAAMGIGGDGVDLAAAEVEP